MVWADTCSTGKILPFFNDKGMKINQNIYHKEILEHALVCSKKKKKNLKKQHRVFQQDSASAHNARKMQEWC